MQPAAVGRFPAMRRNAAEQPLVVRWQEYLVDALLLLADAQAARGRLEDARASVAQALPVAQALCTQDPSNNYWRLSLGRALWWQAWFATGSPDAAASDAADAAAAELSKAYATEPRNLHVVNWLLRTRYLQAEIALTRGDLAGAREHLVAARALVEPAWRTAPDEVLRIWLARIRTLQGDLALRAGDASGATTALTEARDLLVADATPEAPFPRLDTLIRALLLLGQPDQAAPHLRRLERAGYVPLRPFPDGGRSPPAADGDPGATAG